MTRKLKVVVATTPTATPLPWSLNTKPVDLRDLGADLVQIAGGAWSARMPDSSAYGHGNTPEEALTELRVHLVEIEAAKQRQKCQLQAARILVTNAYALMTQVHEIVEKVLDERDNGLSRDHVERIGNEQIHELFDGTIEQIEFAGRWISEDLGDGEGFGADDDDDIDFDDEDHGE